MNILFVGRRTSQESVGVMKKIAGQMAALQALGHTVWSTDIDEAGGWLEWAGGRRQVWALKAYRPAGLSPHLNSAHTLLQAARQPDVQFDLCYIRKPLVDGLHLKALAALRAAGTVVVEEIPTYPYDDELLQQRTLAARVFLAIDRHYRRRLHHDVRYIATYSRHASIYGVPTIPLANAVDMRHIPQRQPPPRGDVLHIGAVSSMFFWHGYDRLIRGLGHYVAQAGAAARQVQLHLVGDGPQRAAWQQLAHQLGLAGQVTFHGVQAGPALDAILAQCDVAVSTLGWFRRSGVSLSFELKTREYIARGIPFVYSCEDEAAAGVPGCCLRVTNDDSPIDMEHLFRFYDALNLDECAKAMQAYAQTHLRWETQMQKVVEAVTANGPPPVPVNQSVPPT